MRKEGTFTKSGQFGKRVQGKFKVPVGGRARIGAFLIRFWTGSQGDIDAILPNLKRLNELSPDDFMYLEAYYFLALDGYSRLLTSC